VSLSSQWIDVDLEAFATLVAGAYFVVGGWVSLAAAERATNRCRKAGQPSEARNRRRAPGGCRAVGHPNGDCPRPRATHLVAAKTEQGAPQATRTTLRAHWAPYDGPPQR